jgi:hypothetical protein
VAVPVEDTAVSGAPPIRNAGSTLVCRDTPFIHAGVELRASTAQHGMQALLIKVTHPCHTMEVEAAGDDATEIAALHEAEQKMKTSVEALYNSVIESGNIDYESVRKALKLMTASVNVCRLKSEALDGVRGNVFTHTPDFSWDPDNPMFLFKDENKGAVLLLAMELMAYGAAFGKQFKDRWDIPELQAWRSPQVGRSFALWPFRAHAMTCVVKDTKGPQTGAAQGSVVQRWLDSAKPTQHSVTCKDFKKPEAEGPKITINYSIGIEQMGVDLHDMMLKPPKPKKGQKKNLIQKMLKNIQSSNLLYCGSVDTTILLSYFALTAANHIAEEMMFFYHMTLQSDISGKYSWQAEREKLTKVLGAVPTLKEKFKLLGEYEPSEKGQLGVSYSLCQGDPEVRRRFLQAL